MENVALVEPLAEAGAISQIVATNVHPVYSDAFTFRSGTLAGRIVSEKLEEYPAVPVCAEDAVDLLMAVRSGIADIAAAKQKLIDSLLSEYHHKIQAFDDDIVELQGRAAELEHKVRNAALSLKGSIKGNLGQVVYSKGRVSYDVKSLDAYAVANPQVLAFRKEGDPSVSIRAVGGAK